MVVLSFYVLTHFLRLKYCICRKLLSLHRYITLKKMKKVVRTVWIGTLSGLAFLAACCSQNGLTRKERKQLVRERDSIHEILTSREGAVIYGTPEIMAKRAADT